MSDLGLIQKVELLYKVLVVGDPAVGKTSFVKRITGQKFNVSESSTIGVDFVMQTIESDNNTIKIQYWDIAGNPNFRSITPQFYRNASAAFVVFDVNNRSSFRHVKEWKKELDDKAQTDGEQIPVILLANKCDLENNVLVDLNQYATKNGFSAFHFVSAKNKTNVDDAVQSLTKAILQKPNNQIHKIPLTLSSDDQLKKNSMGCC
ncbi:ras-related protein rab-32 [Anaeramoeba ignava]|uniref:Ras-related protein rab-32 n=1 Tax=Anaeramoeba ignava TaxID=1746090 RepID=A0A9Q0RE52_ANAIG|nr:ras-related protein rab-32 [Anaeramoeba ignava]|eukprot:Anaeramoba_ignava/a221251_23.p1 GENE.a221251_23~~a221251_23.p1  ORF type:complete len:205 (-),score=70.00 a221251_23:50-664(-)